MAKVISLKQKVSKLFKKHTDNEASAQDFESDRDTASGHAGDVESSDVEQPGPAKSTKNKSKSKKRPRSKSDSHAHDTKSLTATVSESSGTKRDSRTFRHRAKSANASMGSITTQSCIKPFVKLVGSSEDDRQLQSDTTDHDNVSITITFAII